jgi:hypothetical protein
MPATAAPSTPASDRFRAEFERYLAHAAPVPEAPPLPVPLADAPPLLKLKDVVTRTGLTPFTARRLVRRGTLPSFRIGKIIWVRTCDVQAFLAAPVSIPKRRRGDPA